LLTGKERGPASGGIQKKKKRGSADFFRSAAGKNREPGKMRKRKMILFNSRGEKGAFPPRDVFPPL